MKGAQSGATSTGHTDSWGQTRHRQHADQRRQAAADHRSIGPKSAAVAPLSNAPNSFDMPTNRYLTADDAAAQVSGVIICSSVRRMTTLTLSKTPVTKRHEQRQRELAREPEADRGEAEAGHSDEQRPARPLPRRQPRRDQRHRQRADGRCGPQPAEAGGPDVEDVLREDRQQGDGAAEQDREEVERDRGEEHRVRARRTGGRRTPRRGSGRCRTQALRDLPQHRTKTAWASAATAKGRGISGGGDDEPADRGADDRRRAGIDDSQAFMCANTVGGSSCGRIVFTAGDANARAVPTSASSE